jgi:hypothetical protein
MTAVYLITHEVTQPVFTILQIAWGSSTFSVKYDKLMEICDVSLTEIFLLQDYLCFCSFALRNLVRGRICLNVRLDKVLNEPFEKQLSTSYNCLITALNLATVARWNLLIASGELRGCLCCPLQLQAVGPVGCSWKEVCRSSNIPNKKDAIFCLRMASDEFLILGGIRHFVSDVNSGLWLLNNAVVGDGAYVSNLYAASIFKVYKM